MPKISFNGQEYYVPGVYSREEVISFLAGASAAFQVPMLLGGADQGYPHDFDAKKYSAETARGPFTYCGTTAAIKAIYGDDSDVITGFKFGKRHGLPYAYVSCISDLTRATIPVHSVGPVVQGTLYCELFGSPGGHHKVQYTVGNVCTITPMIRHTMLTVTTTALDTRLYVRDNSWMAIGQAVEVGDVNSANVAKVVADKGEELSATGQKVYWVDLTAAVGAVYATGDYAQVSLYDTTQAEVSDVLATGQDFADFINASKWLRFVKAPTWTGAPPIAVAASTPLKEIAAWGVAVPGASPAPILTDYEDFITAMDAGAWETFIEGTGKIPRLFCALSNLSTVHGALRDWAIAKRAEGNPIQVIVGTAWGDTAVTGAADTNSIHRARNLNSQDVALCAGGLDWLEAALSFAPAVWGMVAAGGNVHNLTQDRLTFSMREVTWDERNDGELTLLHRGGVITQRFAIDNSGARWVVSQGINTLQNNTSAWNEGTNDTPLIMQRNIADYAQRDQAFILAQTQLGANVVTANTVRTVLVRWGKAKVEQGVMTNYTIQSVSLNSSGAGWDAVVAHYYPITPDYLTVTTQVVVGEE